MTDLATVRWLARIGTDGLAIWPHPAPHVQGECFCWPHIGGTSTPSTAASVAPTDADYRRHDERNKA